MWIHMIALCSQQADDPTKLEMSKRSTPCWCASTKQGGFGAGFAEQSDVPVLMLHDQMLMFPAAVNSNKARLRTVD